MSVVMILIGVIKLIQIRAVKTNVEKGRA